MDSRNPPFLSRSGKQESNALLLYISENWRKSLWRVSTFEFYRCRFHFRALDEVRFPPSKSGNVVRGAFGLALRETAAPATYQRLFQPMGEPDRSTPSGLADWPRPFVLRASHLNGLTIAAGDAFFFDVHIFEVREPFLTHFQTAFTELATKGIGVGRGRAALDRVEQLDLTDAPLIPADPPRPLEVSLIADPRNPAVTNLHLQFLTPTELKNAGGLADRPEFPILFSRLRDRLSTLRAFYGAGPFDLDFRAIGERANAIRLIRCNLTWETVERKSGRTGQVHPLGGFLGEAAYEGDLTEFVPLAARRGAGAGVGRQTVWGKGEVRIVSPVPPESDSVIF